MHGCPNRCRHCWLGSEPNRKLPDDDLRWAAAQFRHYLETAETTIESLTVASWFREPDFSAAYRHLYELEDELSDGKPARYELHSVWRLARDEEYATWAKSVGPATCQLSFFGMEETNDWFYRRKGAFRDALTATERLLDVGMKPRWQIFLTRKLIPEIDELLNLISRLGLHERVRELGGEFQLFMHAPGPDGEGRYIEHLRPILEEVALLPEKILEPSRKHFDQQTLWQTESVLLGSILGEENPPEGEQVVPAELWFHITNSWEVFANVGTLESWWKLGNLKTDSVETIVHRFERDQVLGLEVLLHYPPNKWAAECGDPDSSKIYSDSEDLLSLYRTQHCEKAWRER